jgi:O-antigen/teichoic acid export membrane protein
MSGLSAGLAVGKLFVGLAAAVVGLGVTSLMFGLALSTMAGGAIGLWLARDLGQIQFGVFSADVGRAMLAFTLFWVLVSADVPFARAFFDGDEAGHYAAAAVLGKAVLWLPSVIGLLVFPRLASASASGERSHALTFAGVAGLYVLGHPAFRLLYGEEYLPAADVAWRIGLACVPLAIVNLVLYERVAHRSNRFLVWLGVGVVVELAGFAVMHSSGGSFALVLAVVATALLAVLLLDRAR